MMNQFPSEFDLRILSAKDFVELYFLYAFWLKVSLDPFSGSPLDLSFFLSLSFFASSGV